MKKQRLFFLNDNIILVCEGGNVCQRASKQCRLRKMISAKPFATKSMRKRHGIDCGGHEQQWLIAKCIISQTGQEIIKIKDIPEVKAIRS